MSLETEDAQNILGRVERDIYLNVQKPSVKVKRQYHKAVKSLADARFELDVLNDMKSEES